MKIIPLFPLFLLVSMASTVPATLTMIYRPVIKYTSKQNDLSIFIVGAWDIVQLYHLFNML